MKFLQYLTFSTIYFFFYVIFTINSQTNVDATCIQGYFESPINQHCYRIGTATKNKSDAMDECEGDGAHLATITNQANAEYLGSTFTSPNHVWIGLSDEVSEGKYVWDVGTSSFRNWMSGEPNGYTNENCVIMYDDGTWSDYGCINVTPYALCEYNPTNDDDYNDDATNDTLDALYCMPGYRYYSGNDNCYMKGPAVESRSDAKARCELDGAHLVTVTDAPLNYYLVAQYTDVGDILWIGLNDIASEGTYVWDYGASTYNNWMPYDPNDYNNNEDCVIVDYVGIWFDISCGNQYYAMCEIKSWKTASPTRFPTSLPSSLPSGIPTISPTSLPTDYCGIYVRYAIGLKHSDNIYVTSFFEANDQISIVFQAIKSWKIGIDESMFLHESNVTIFERKLYDDLTEYETTWQYLATLSDFTPSSINQFDSLLADRRVSLGVVGMLIRSDDHHLHHYQVSNCGMSWSYQSVLLSNDYLGSDIESITDWNRDWI